MCSQGFWRTALAFILNKTFKKPKTWLEFPQVLRTKEIESSEDFKEAMRLAAGLKLTFYDASYLYLAKNKGLILVTEDKELSKKAEKTNTETITVKKFLEKAYKL